jgi:hypothetical protein
MTKKELWELFQNSMYPWNTKEENVKGFANQLLKRITDDTTRTRNH